MKDDTPFEPRYDEVFFMYEEEELVIFEVALAKLLLDEVLIPFDANQKKKRASIELWVNCSDVFVWGTADCEPITKAEIKELYKMHIDPKNKGWGNVKWVCKKRNMKPQTPVISRMEELNVWCDLMESLPDNKGS